MTRRVAAVQFATGTDVDDNLATCLRLVDAAVAEGAELVVLPEFCNALSWYDDHEQAVALAVDLDGPFVGALAAAAARHGIWLKAHVSTHRGAGRITATNVLLSPAGTLAGVADKLVLMGGERLHMSEAEELGDVIDTPLGRLGLYSCMDGVIPEPPRLLAVAGAEVLLNSLNSFALDEASLHIPVRAAENRCWVVAANKVGPLIPPAHLSRVAQMVGVPETRLVGAGESQVVAPDGTVVAIGPREGEAVVVADIDPALAQDKRRATGTDVLQARRPAAYARLTSGEQPAPHDATGELAVACVAGVDEIAGAVAAGARLVVLPQLVGDVAACQAAAGDALVVLSVLQGGSHTGLVVDRSGVVHEQPTLHPSATAPGATELADDVHVLETPWGRLALVVGEDVVFPEAFRLAALAGADVVACPTQLAEAWEYTLGLRERAAENRVNVVAASRPTPHGEHVVVPMDGDFTLWTEWTTPFAGSINAPAVVSGAGTLLATVRPGCAANKEISRGTDLLWGRPWRLCGPLADEPVPV